MLSARAQAQPLASAGVGRRCVSQQPLRWEIGGGNKKRNTSPSANPPHSAREGVSGAKTPAKKRMGCAGPGSGRIHRCREGHLPVHASLSAAPHAERGARGRPLFCGVSPTSTLPSLSWPSSLPKGTTLYRVPFLPRSPAPKGDCACGPPPVLSSGPLRPTTTRPRLPLGGARAGAGT